LGNGHQFYTGVDREPDSAAIPTIANGMDVPSIVGVLTNLLQRTVADRALNPGAPFRVDMDEMGRLLAELPDEPDEKLR
jgi:hypothetical protein